MRYLREESASFSGIRLLSFRRQEIVMETELTNLSDKYLRTVITSQMPHYVSIIETSLSLLFTDHSLLC
jgi:hypothetical protein